MVDYESFFLQKDCVFVFGEIERKIVLLSNVLYVDWGIKGI